MNAGLDPRLRWQKAVLADVDLPRHVAHVALVLSTSLGYDMTGGASIAELVALSGRDKKTVRTALRTLCAGGWLAILRGPLRGKSTTYRAELPALFGIDGVPPGSPHLSDGVPPGSPHLSDGVPPGSPHLSDGVPPGSPLFNTKNYVRTLPDSIKENGVDGGREAAVGQVLADLGTTKLRPRGPAHVGRLRQLIGQRLAAGVSPADIAEDARTVTIDPMDPPALFASTVRRVPVVLEPVVPRPDWCGDCDERTRLVELDDGRAARCQTCHPSRVSV